ncbi:aspartate aminotransferase family protein [Aeribacillus composti]|uniref:aminotransferase family protein n=1 Tax=Aeribacillus composti TaxID=1868734 RepID=UPI002E1FCE7C|nr:aspartate aminotransferase family protein [Aeribacillus composti]MED1442739.1 aspartate aminotransferase family protein [Aeribacillus composti]
MEDLIIENKVKELIDLDKKFFLHPSSSIKEQQQKGPELIIKEGKGIYLYDIHGNKLIDGLSSLWNVNIGHGRTELAEAAMKQMSKLGYSSTFGTVSHEPVIRLASKIAQITPGSLKTTFFTSGGSEATDSAFKLVRHYWKLKGFQHRTKIIARKNAYHGLTIGSTSATGITHFNDFIGAKAPDFIHVDSFSPEALCQAIEDHGAESVAAFIAEPVQGAGGVHVPPPKYFQEIRKICNDYNILFIADEVITGFGRTGKMFAMEHWGIVPDVMCFAKGVTSGYCPLGGVVISEKIHEELIDLSNDVLFHGFTYSGHPVSCAVAMKNIDIIEKENLIENAKKMGDELLTGLKTLQEKFSVICEVRGLGLMAAIEFNGRNENEKLSKKVSQECLKRGLICRNVIHGRQDALVLAPPLTIDKKEVQIILSILFDSLNQLQ